MDISNGSRFNHGLEGDSYPRPFSSSGTMRRSFVAFGISLMLLVFAYFLTTWSEYFPASIVFTGAAFVNLLAPIWDSRTTHDTAYELITDAPGEEKIHVQDKNQFRLWCARLLLASLLLAAIFVGNGAPVWGACFGVVALGLLLSVIFGKFPSPSTLVLDKNGLYFLNLDRWVARAKPAENKEAYKDTSPEDYHHMLWNNITSITPTSQGMPGWRWLREPMRYIDIRYLGYEAGTAEPDTENLPMEQRILLLHCRMPAETLLDLLYLLWLNPSTREYVGQPELLLKQIRQSTTVSVTTR